MVSSWPISAETIHPQILVSQWVAAEARDSRLIDGGLLAAAFLFCPSRFKQVIIFLAKDRLLALNVL
jgi:hypothetical protein